MQTSQSTTNTERPGITLTRDQLEAWAGKALTDDQVESLEESIQFSSIPEAIALIAEQFPYNEEEEEKGQCQDCGEPAAYRLAHVALDGGDFLLCPADAAYHAAHGDKIEYLLKEDEEP